MASRVPLDAAAANTMTETRKLADLLEVSQTLGSTLNLKAAMTRALELLLLAQVAVLGIPGAGVQGVGEPLDDALLHSRLE